MKHYAKAAMVGAGLAVTIGAGMALTPHHVGPADIYPPADVPGVTNPDITQSTIGQTICNPSWSTKSIRPPVSYTDALKVSEMTKYHLSGVKGDYELDHLISLELGGNPRDPANLWMEPYNASIPDGGAKIKDTVENNLHKEVCAGTKTLQEAQTIIVTDWYAYYKHQTPSYGSVDSAVDTDDL